MIEDLTLIKNILSEAQSHMLEVETVYYALKYMKEDPSISISEAMTLGYLEWIK